jgi:hypothetical protein
MIILIRMQMINPNTNQTPRKPQDWYRKPKRTRIGTDGGDTSINVPGDNVRTDVISPREGASDDKSDESLVLPSNPPPNGKISMYQKYLE